ncbi:MAG: carbohydrate ABC transporter permease [Lachnospiraceae bacterium]|nr:carbohydrate ABC transporter permease [Lachnospiraceae bacterium]
MINKAAIKRKITKFTTTLVLMILMFGLCFLILQPLLNKISVSLMAERDLYDSTIVAVPKHFTTENYSIAYQLMDYTNSFMTTFSVAMAVSVLQVCSCLVVGYGIARYDFPLKKFWFAMLILMIVVPQQTYSAALQLWFRNFDIFGIFRLLTGSTLDLTGTVAPVLMLAGTCTGLKCGLYVYLFRQYFRNIPKDIEEAAYIDGCGTLRTLFSIMLPDAIPLASSCFLFSFVWQWTDNYFTTLLMKSANLLPARLNGIASTLISYMSPVRPSLTYQNAISATGTILLLVPIIIVYLVAQKKFVQSLSATAVKM